MMLPLIDMLFEIIGLDRYKTPGHPYRKQPGEGVARAAKRLADYRAQQAKRLENAAPPKITRQQYRRQEMLRF